MSVYTKAAFWSITTQISVLGSMLARNILFARFLSSNDFSIALTFGVVLSLFEYISNFGQENFMQRSSAGDSEKFQATMHSMMILRGLIISVVIIAIAPFVPSVLNLTSIDFNYAFLAVVPLINSFSHLDHHRFHRKQNYVVTAKIGLIADISSIFVACFCILWFENYWAFYVSFVYRHSISTILSHWFAQRKYALALEQTHIKSLLVFGIPLLLVGLLKYIGVEFDKAVIARFAGLEVFAIYVLTGMLLANGTNIITLALSKIFIRRVNTSGSKISSTVKANGIIHCFLVAPLLAVLCGFGEDIIQLIFGQQYSPLPFLILAMGAVIGMRSINQWLNQTVIAASPTWLMLTADLSRVFVAFSGLLFIYNNATAIDVAMAFLVSEIAYFLVLSFLLNKQFSIIESSFTIFSIYLTCSTFIFMLYSQTHNSPLLVKVLSSTFLSVSIWLGFLIFSSTCRNQIRALADQINSFRKAKITF